MERKNRRKTLPKEVNVRELYKEKFDLEQLEMEELATFAFGHPNNFKVERESDWWLEYCFDRILNFFKILIHYISLGFLFKSKRYQFTERQKKEDDYRPINHSNWLMSPVQDKKLLALKIKWNFENCEPYLNRRINKKINFRNKEDQIEDHKYQMEFRKNALDQFGRLKREKFKNVSLIVGDFEFLADSHVLSSQSGAFRRQLFHGRRRDDHRSLLVPDVTPKEMEALLVYIYCRTWPTSMMENGQRLFKGFIQLLDSFQVPLAIEKSCSSKINSVRQDPSYDCEPEDILHSNAFLPKMFSCFEVDSQQAANLIMESEIQNKLLNVEGASESVNPWDFPLGFVYKAETTSQPPTADGNARNEDLRQKMKDAKEFLKELKDEPVVQSCCKISSTSNWIDNHH